MMVMRNVLWLSFACMVLTACAKTTASSGGSSETHFLISCDDDCGAGLECVCGVCTEPCDSNDGCHALNDAASCQAAANGCGTAMVCDVECNEDDDCRPLGAEHECDSGRCRVPEAPPTAVPDAGPPQSPASCSPHAVATYLADNQSLPSCGMFTPDDVSPGAELDCIREKSDVQQPFYVEWRLAGIDSELTTAFAGLREGGDYVVYLLGYDSYSSLDPTGPQTHWSRCSSFNVAASCEDLEDCFTCPTEPARSCDCRVIDDEPKTECTTLLDDKN